MGRHDRSLSPPPRPPMGQRPPEPTYHFENYEDGGKPKWAPGASNSRDYDDYRDSRRDQRRPRKERDRDDAPPPPPPAAPRDARPPKPRRRRSYSSSSSDSDAPPPRRSGRREEPRRDRRREQEYDSYDEHYPPRRPREDKGKDRGGYISDDRHNRPRKEPRDDDRDRRDRPRDDRDRRDRHRDDRYDDMFSGGRDSRRDPRYDDRDRRDRYRDDDRSGGRSKSGSRAVGKPGQPEWQRQALGMFKEYAMPLLKKEGQKYIQKQMGGFGSKR